MGNYIIISLITQFLVLLIVVMMTRVFYENRKTSFITMCLSVGITYPVLSILSIFIRVSLPAYWLLLEIPFILIGYFIITLNYESTIIKRFAVIISSIMVLLVSNIISEIFITTLFPSLVDDEYIRASIMASIPIAFLITTLLRRFKSIRKNSVIPRIALAVPVVVLLTLVGFVFLLFAIYSDMYVVEGVMSVLVAVLFVTPIFLIFYLYDTLSVAYENRLKSALHEQEKEYYFAQCKLMQESAEQMKAFRHDFKLHLATIQDYAANNKINEITEYLDALLGKMGKSEVYIKTGNIAFDSIINFKLKNIKHDDIELDLRVFIPTVLNVETIDIVTILGNLLDNALDAVAKVDKKMLRLDIIFQKGTLFMKLDNTFDGEVKYSEEEKIITSKNEDEHGYGLKNIQQSVDKYDGYFEYTHDGDYFSAGVLLYVKNN